MGWLYGWMNTMSAYEIGDEVSESAEKKRQLFQESYPHVTEAQ